MTFILILITAFLILQIGYMVITVFGFLKKASLIEKLSFSWGLGVGLVGLQLFFYSLLNIHWSRLSILLPWIILAIISVIKSKRDKNNTMSYTYLPPANFSGNTLQIALASLIILLLFFTGFESILRPIQAWDGWDNWVLRPKVFLFHNNLNLDYVRYTNDDYPLVIPLMETFGYIVMGGVNDRYILFLFFMSYTALGGLFFARTKKVLGTTPALLFTFLLLATQNLIRHGGRFEVGQADLTVGYYIFAGTMLLLDFIKTKDIRTLLLLSIFLGITGQIKNDGMAFVAIVNLVLFCSIILWRKYVFLLFMLPCLLLIAPWQVYKISNHYPANMIFFPGNYIHFDRILTIFLSMSKEFFNVQNWSLLWITFIAVVIINRKDIGKVKIPLLVLTLQWLSYFIIFMMTPREPAGHIANIIDKLYLHLAPLAVFIIALLVKTKNHFK